MRARWAVLGLAGLVLFVVFACGEDDDEDAPAPASASEAAAASPLPAPPASDGSLDDMFVHRDINHVLATGQSLSVGAAGGPPISTAQPYANLMFGTGVIAGNAGLTTLVPLVEGTVQGGTSPNVETMSAGFANLVTKLAREEVFAGEPNGARSHDLLVSAHGIGGAAYSILKKGTGAFTAGMAQTQAAFEIARSLGKSYVVRAVTNVHGETDHTLGNTEYAQNLADWQRDYEAEVKAITGQADPVPMLHTQVSSWTKYGQPTSIIPAAQLAASVASDGKIVLVGPKYHLAYSGDGVHLSNEGYRHMGEDYAKVYRRVVLEGRRWEPLRPILVTRAGNVLTIKFAVPAPPLVFDGTLVSDPGNKGFAFVQDGPAVPAITGVTIAGPDTVTVELASEPTGTNRRLRYAYVAPAGASAGPTSGARGNLRDSDATASRHGYKLYNWCIHFDEAVP